MTGDATVNLMAFAVIQLEELCYSPYKEHMSEGHGNNSFFKETDMKA